MIDPKEVLNAIRSGHNASDILRDILYYSIDVVCSKVHLKPTYLRYGMEFRPCGTCLVCRLQQAHEMREREDLCDTHGE